MPPPPDRRPPPPPGLNTAAVEAAPAVPAEAPQRVTAPKPAAPNAHLFNAKPSAPPLADPASYGFGPWYDKPDPEPEVVTVVAESKRKLLPVVIAAGLGTLLAGLAVVGAFLWLNDDTPEPVETVFNFPDAGTSTQLGGEILDIQGVLAKVQPSVVTISAGNQTRRGMFEGAGSGVVISDDGLVLTNAHVIAGADTIEVTFFDGTTKTAKLVGSFPDDDIAVIRAENISGLLPAELGTVENLKVGDDVVAIGNALNLGATPSVTKGIVSAKDRSIESDVVRLVSLIQTDAAINPGNSGGPLVDARGRVVGINTAIIDDAQNIGFAISIDVVKPLIERAVAGDAEINPDTAFLGVSTITLSGLDQTVRDSFGITSVDGAFVQEPVQDSPADRAGIQRGDVLTALDGNSVTSAEDVARYVRYQRPGESIEVTFERNGQTETVTVELVVRGN